MNQVVTVRLYGVLGSKFGRRHRLAVSNAAEAVRALSVLLPGFEAFMVQSKDMGLGYAVFYGKQNIGELELQSPHGNREIRIAPRVLGGKNKFLQIIIGTVLIAVGLLTANGFLFNLGMSLVLGGIMQLLAPAPKGREEQEASAIFNGPVNTQAQGSSVPILYGELIVGSAVLSAGINVTDTAYVPEPSTGAGAGWAGLIEQAIAASGGKAPKLNSTAYAQVLDLVSAGEIYGWADPDNPLTCYYLDGTPIQNADLSYNFKNVHVDWRWGTQTQDYIKGFDTISNEILVNDQLEYGLPWSQALTNLNLSAVRIRMSILALSKTNPKDGNVDGYKVNYKIEVATDGGPFVLATNGVFDGKSFSEYERTHRVNLPPASSTGWVVRVTRTTPQGDPETIQDDTYIKSYAELIDVKLRHPMKAVVSLHIDARQFNSIPARAFRLKGKIIRIPSNYDPDTREYDGVWDGTFVTAYSNNPAWVFYDLLLDDLNGLGRVVTAAMVDKWLLYEIGQYCDVMVDDGKGGEEPRMVANVYLQNRQDALRWLQNMASIFRGVMYAGSNAIMAVSDMPADPVYTYTPANIIGEFVYSGTAKKVRHTVALVGWNDLNDMGKLKYEYVEGEPEWITRYGVWPTEFISLGATSQGQAQRHGKYVLASEHYEDDSVSFPVGLDGTLVAPGKIVYIADPLRAGRRTGGRIVNYYAPTREVTVDNADGLEVGDTIICILPNGLPESRVIVNITGRVLEVGETVEGGDGFSATPIPGSVWAAQNVELNLQKFRIISVTDSTDPKVLGYNITALKHVEGKFAYAEDGTPIMEPPITDTPLPYNVTDISITAFERIVSALPVLVGVVEWTAAQNAVRYHVQLMRNDGEWTVPAIVDGTHYEVEGFLPGVYRAAISSVNSKGFIAPPVVSDEFTIVDPTFTVFVLLEIAAGVVIVDCSKGEQFRVYLTENVTDVQFINVGSESTVIIEVFQTGSYTWAFPASVVPVNGVTYVPTTGGTEDQPKIDTLGLYTDSAGVLWALRYDLDDSPSTGGATTITPTITPNPAYGYAAANPSIALAVTVDGGVAPYTHAWSRADGGIGDWAGSSGNTGGGNFNCTSLTSATPTFSRTGSADGYVAQNWRHVVTDANGLQGQVLLQIALEDDGEVPGGSGGWQCVWAEAFLPDGRKAREVKAGQRIAVVDPLTLERSSALVSYAKLAMAECVKLVCQNGTELTCSTTAPIPVPGGMLLPAPEMQGMETVTGEGWSRVVDVVPMGTLPVMHITCANNCFWAGNFRGRYMAHHNIKYEP